MKELRHRRILFWTILLAAIAVRCVGFVSVPGGVNQDEAMAGVDAWALAQYGTDRYGIFLPVHFTAWGYGQMSVLLSYCMVPFIRLLGFCTLAVRLPMLLVSCGSVALAYLTGKRLFSPRFGLLVMALTAFNPWHFMQSRWSLDCNLFPHVFLLAFYLMLLGLEKRRYLYLSMIFFGLTFYCYGVAVYSVPLFLAGYAAWCIRKRQLRVREVLLCILLFTVAALPEIMVMAINYFGWPTVETPFFTMSYFPESVRSSDILLFDFSFPQLWRNLLAMVCTCLLQCPGAIYNSLPKFGPMYHVSIPFMVLGIVQYTREVFAEKDMSVKAGRFALWCFLLMGVWVGIVTYEVNVNRINIIFFPLIFLCGYGIRTAVNKLKGLRYMTFAVYGVCFVLFLHSYFTEFAVEIQTYFNVNFLNAVKTADMTEGYERLYITSNADWQVNPKMTEILTQYACRIDAAYYQEKTCVTGGRTLLPYSQRYHFIDAEEIRDVDPEGLYLVHVTEMQDIPFSYDILERDGHYVLLSPLP